MKKTMQISPYGVFEKIEEDGKRKIQLCDAVAFEAVVADWIERGRPRILLDYLHKRGEAAAWIDNLRVDAAEGLVGDCDYTPPGERAVFVDKIWRYPSADWWCSPTDHRPIKLETVALTNTPNIPVKPIVNSAGGSAAGGSNPNNKRNTRMDKIKTMLGLPPDADDAAVETALQALIDANASAKADALKAKGESVAAANADRIQNSAEFVAAYVQNPDAAEALLKTLKPVTTTATQTTPVRVVNSAVARPPAQPTNGGRKFASRAEASKALAAQPVGQRQKFYADHQADFED